MSSETVQHSARSTLLLALLAAVSAICTLAVYAYFNSARAAAVDAAATRVTGLADLQALSHLDHGAGAAAAPVADELQMNRQLRSAAVSAGMSDQILSIEPGQPQQMRDTDMKDTPVFLQLNGVTLRQIVMFLRRLGEQDVHVIPRNIILNAPSAGEVAAKTGETELWTAEVTLAYLTYNPRAKAAP